MALGTKLFNLTFGMNDVLTMDFLIPTLRVAKTLKWNGQELSLRLEDLERLDKTKLTTVAHMYAQKRRTKAHHDKHIMSKNIKK